MQYVLIIMFFFFPNLIFSEENFLAPHSSRLFYDNELVDQYTLSLDYSEVKIERLTAGNFKQFEDEMIEIAESLPDTTPAKHLYEMVDNEISYAFVAIINGKVAGYIITWLKYIPDDQHRELEIATIGINKHYEKHGVGNILLNTIARLGITKRRELRDKSLYLVTRVLKTNSLYNYFLKRGFTDSRYGTWAMPYSEQKYALMSAFLEKVYKITNRYKRKNTAGAWQRLFSSFNMTKVSA